MKIIVTADANEMSKKASELFIEEINRNSEMVLGLATGSTPVGLYNQLIEAYRAGKVDFSKVKTFNLDEYYGLATDHPASYHFFMQQNLFSHINISPENVHIPNGVSEDVERYCKEYEEMIKEAGGIDLQLLGIGENAHIGFNEPGTALGAKTQLIQLAQKTIDSNARFFLNKEDVPKKAISMGIKTIMRSRKIVLLASGEKKAQAIYNTVVGTVESSVPASVLQLHPDVVLIIDREAVALLEPKDIEIEA
ncbi:MAG: glucosamine-6-phosphate deaminase [Halanaerobiales bacterium]|nr:glucosamine-6-phosphate deaminase [Halanaerobiales bacterium]